MRAGPVILDGGLATELERAGHRLGTRLWSAALLRSDPEAVRAAHRRFFAAGAAVATTVSYQASFEGLRAAGESEAGARRWFRRCVDVAREAAGTPADRWVAASVGPYGAVLPDGQEYRGTYADPRRGGMSARALATWHRPRLEALAEAGPDVLACETLPAAEEVRALVSEVARLGIPAWISLTAVIAADGSVRTRLGEPVAPLVELMAQVPNVVAGGVNCLGPSDATRAVTALGPIFAARGLPLVVYPNSGETWHPARRRWERPADAGDLETDDGGDRMITDAPAWVAAGARLVGGCCRVGPSRIAALAAALSGGPRPPHRSRRAEDGG